MISFKPIMKMDFEKFLLCGRQIIQMVPEFTLLFVIEHSSIVTRFGYPFQTMGSGAFTKQFYQL